MSINNVQSQLGRRPDESLAKQIKHLIVMGLKSLKIVIAGK